MDLARDGATLVEAALDEEALEALERSLAGLPTHSPGIRLFGNAAIRRLLDPSGPVGRHAASALGERCRPVRAILFDKSAQSNWALGWHQDRTIAVAARVDVPGYRSWNSKAGHVHVEPPFELIERMVTLRVHIDRVTDDNAPLLVAPGSHRLGRIAEPDIQAVIDRCGIRACLAAPGDIWVYATPILHASKAAARPSRRRVLQVDYSADQLEMGLAWAGI